MSKPLSPDTALRRMGDIEAIACARSINVPVEDVRAGSIMLIRESFNRLKREGKIPPWQKLQPFRLGWRSTAAGATHGKPATYAAGCRCDACKEAWRVYAKDRREAKKREFAAAEMEKYRSYTEGAIERQRRAVQEIEETRWRLAVGVTGADEVGWQGYKGRMVSA